MTSILERWDITLEELTEVVDKNPSLRGMVLGYLAELKLEKLYLSHEGISDINKDDDHDRKKKGDRVIRYKGLRFVFESKSLQTATVKRTDEGWAGKANVDASDRREIQLPNGEKILTTCLLTGEFDILAVNIFAFQEKWRFVFAKNSDLPTSRYKKYSEYQRQNLLATSVDIHWPPKHPFRDEPFTLMNEIIDQRK